MFSTKLKELMTENHITKSELIKAVGLTDGAINGWLIKGAQPTAENIIKIADYFQVSADYILGRENDTGLIEIKNELSQIENEIISMYRKLDERRQFLAYTYVKGLAAN